MVEAAARIEVPPTSPNQIQPTSTPEHLPLDTQQITISPNTKPNERSTTAANHTLKDTRSNFTLKDNSSNFTLKLKFHLSCLDTTRHVRPAERVETTASSRAVRQARHSQKAWGRHVARLDTLDTKS